MPRSRAWMYIDETSNLGAGGALEGASALVVTKRGKRELARLRPKLEARFARWGIPPTLELHAERWVQRRNLFPAHCYPSIRIRAMKEVLGAVGLCHDVWFTSAMVDHSQPHPEGFDAREAVFERLLLDFEAWLARSRQGSVIFDKNAPGPVIDAYHRLRDEGHLRRQASPPLPANSLDHYELRIADLHAYFLLQQNSAGAAQVRKAGAQNIIELAEPRNLPDWIGNGVRVAWL